MTERRIRSGDCPICNTYCSQSAIVWRDKAFCCNEHRRQYMWESIAEETLDEHDAHLELWDKLEGDDE